MTTTQNATTTEGAQESADALAKCLLWVRQASAGGHALWDYHQGYQGTLDQLAADGLVVKWMNQDLTDANWGHYYIAALGYWTPEAFMERASNVLRWLSRHRERIVSDGYGDLERWGDRQNVLAMMARWVCAIADLASSQERT